MFHRQLLAAGVAALTLGAAVALGDGDIGKSPVAPSGPCFAADKGGRDPSEPALTAHAEVYVTVHGCLVAYYRGSLVESREVTVRAANGQKFLDAVEKARADFERSLNARGKRWDRIECVLLRIDGAGRDGSPRFSRK